MGLETGGQDAQGLSVDAAVIEEQGFDKRRVIGAALAFLALELVEQQGGGGGGSEPGTMAKQAQEFEAEGFAGLWAAGGDVERRGEGSGLEAVGVKGPEGEEVELVGGAREVLAVEIDDLVDDGLGLGLSSVVGV